MAEEMHSHMGLHRLFTRQVRIIALLALGLIALAPFLSNLGLTYSWSYVKLFALQAAVLITWAGLLAVRPVRTDELLGASGVGLPMVLIFAWALLSTLWSNARWAATQPLIELAYMGLAVVGLANLFTAARIRQWFTTAYGCAAGLACLIYVPLKIEANAQRATNPQAPMTVYPFDNPNVAAAFAILPMTVGFSYAVAACRGRAARRAGVLGGIVAVICGAAIVVSGSAAALAGGAGALVLVGVFACRGKLRKHLLIALVALAALGALAIAGGLWRTPWFAAQLGARPALWKGAMALVEKAPVRGLGLGSFPVEYTSVYPREYAAHELWSPVVEKAHSLPLHVVAELGLVGLALAALLIAFAARRAAVANYRAVGTERVLLRGLVCGCLGMLAQGLVGVPLHYVEGYTGLVLALAMIGGLGNSWWRRTPPSSEPSPLARRLPAAILALLFLATAGPGLLSQIYQRQGMHAPRRSTERVEKLEDAVSACWPTLWTFYARDELANATLEWGQFVEHRPEQKEFAKQVFQAGLEQMQAVNRLAPNLGRTRKKEAVIRLKLGQVDAAAEAVIDYCRKDPFDAGAYDVWRDILSAARRQGRTQLARPEEAVRLLKGAEKKDCKRLPRAKAHAIKLFFEAAAAALSRQQPGTTHDE